jgi:dolichol-phosphate mannosyltransferase
MVPWLGYPHAVVNYEEPRRPAGEPKYTFGKSLRLAQDGLFSFSTVPLRMVTWLGVLLTCLGVVYFLYTMAIVMLGRTVAGWASVIVWVLVIGGVQLISLGILAQYMGMLFEQGRSRPLYVLKQRRLSTSVPQSLRPE